MASQPTFAPYTPLRNVAPKPNIRIAYIAGDAATAIHRGMATKPAAVRESTLEELAIAGLTDELIAAGRELLSPAMYAAFLRWGETASHACASLETDEKGLLLCKAVYDAVAAITDLAATNIHDVVFKAYLINVEAGDCPDFGPVNGDAADGSKLPGLIDSVSNDLRTLSPVIALLDDLATLAWASSGEEALSLTVTVGGIITSAFSGARGELGLDIPPPAPLPVVLDGYSAFMRGPLVAWQKAYAVYEAAAAELAAYERDVYRPTAARYTEVRGDFRVPATSEMEAQLATIFMDEVQERFDDFVMAKHDASERLWALPAPSAAELATKLKIFLEAEGWDLTCAGRALDRITADARRFGKHGAFLKPDVKLLDAFQQRRTEAAYWFSADRSVATDDIEERSNAIVLKAEEVLFGTAAATIEGVAAKLRTLFPHISQDAYSEHAVADPTNPEFSAGLKVGDGNDQVLWSCIEDLARIGGINLAEQGA